MVAWLFACLVAALVVSLGWLVPLLERGHLSSQQVLSYASNFLYNETPSDEMTNVIKACNYRRSGIPEIFTTRSAHPYCPLVSLSLSLSLFSFFSLSRHRPLVYHRNVFIYATEIICVIAYFRRFCDRRRKLKLLQRVRCSELMSWTPLSCTMLLCPLQVYFV